MSCRFRIAAMALGKDYPPSPGASLSWLTQAQSSLLR